MNDTQIAQCIEILCQCGCSEVRAVIKRIEANQSVAQLEGFTVQERRLVMEELKAIMAVYDQRD